jgi:EmrB/QacA subfamily drug resistance transporter
MAEVVPIAHSERGRVSSGSSPDGLPSGIWGVMTVVLLGPFMTQIDSTVVNVSLAAIQNDLHSTISSAQWIMSGYLLALALMLPINGWLVDRFGAKRLYLGCFAAFTLASMLCGLASTMEQLIVARVLQGMAGGLLAPMTQLMVARIAGRHMSRVIGYGAVPVLIAPILGPVVAGAILKVAHWPWLFYINLPIGVLSIVLASWLLPTDDATYHKRPFDLLGLLLISPGLVLTLYGLDRVSHKGGGLTLLLGLALLIGFYWDIRRKKDAALIDLGLFENRFFSAAVLTQFLSNGVIYAGQFLVPLYLISGCGLTSAQAGWIIAAMGIGMICPYPMMGFLVDRFGYRKVASAGVLLNLAGTLPFLWMTQHHYSPTLAVFGLFIRGAGQGATGIPSMSAAYISVRKERLGFANTAINIIQRLGGPVATTLMAIILSVSANSASRPLASGFFVPFVVLILLQGIVFASASRLPTQIVKGEA